MAVPNLTQVQAVERAELLDVDSYTIELDLTDGAGRPGEETFRSTTTVRFSCRAPGASSWIDLVAAQVSSATLNGVALDIAGYDEATGIPLPALAAANELLIEADGRYMNTGEGCIASPTPSTAASTSTASSRPPTPSACTPASTSPTSRQCTASGWWHPRTGS